MKCLVLLHPGPCPSGAIVVQSKAEPDGDAYIKTLRQQLLGERLSVAVCVGLRAFGCLFLARLLSVVAQSPASRVVLLPDIFLCTSAARQPPNSLLDVELQSLTAPDCLCDSKCGLYPTTHQITQLKILSGTQTSYFSIMFLVERTRAKYCCTARPFNHHRWTFVGFTSG